MRLLIGACLIGGLFFSNSLYGQGSRTRYLLWVTPTGNHKVTIDGVAAGLMAIPGGNGELHVNGINLELSPVAFFTVPGSMVLTMLNITEGDSYADGAEKISTTIHGFSFGPGMFDHVEMHGLSISFNSYVGRSFGTEMSFWMNSNYFFSGSQLSVWGNRAVDGSGLQIGMFNSCSDCRVLQIGFLNRIGNRVLPLINFSFGKGKKRSQRKKRR